MDKLIVFRRACVYEEEDYQPMQYGYRLVPEVTDQRAIGMLKEVEEELNRRLRGKGGKDEVSSSCNVTYCRRNKNSIFFLLFCIFFNQHL